MLGENPLEGSQDSKKEINTLDDVRTFEDLYELIDKKQPDEKTKQEMRIISLVNNKQ